VNRSVLSTERHAVTSNQALNPAPAGPLRPAGRFSRLQRTGLAGLVGLLAASVSLGVAQLAAVAVGPTSAPIVAVGQGVIRLTPEWAKEFAIRTFGQNDKLALISGTLILLALVALLLGVFAVRRRLIGYLGVVLFGVIGVVAAWTHPTARGWDALPSVVGAIAGLASMRAMLRTFPAPAGHAYPAVPALAGTASVSSETASPETASPETASPETASPETLDAESAGTTPVSAGDGPGGNRLGSQISGLLRGDRKGPGLNRRGFLFTSVASLTVAAVSGGLGQRLLEQRFAVADARAKLRLPAPKSPAPALPSGSDLKIPGLTPFTTSNSDFYRVDTAIVMPQVNPDDWQLRIHGQVDHPMTLTFGQLLDRGLVERDITLTCVSNEVGGNLAGEARWLGVPLRELLAEIGVHDGADQLVTRSVDGWTCGTPTEVVRNSPNALLAVGMNGEPLPIAHGFPVRMIVPGLYGYVSATKWIVDMEFTTFDAFDPYWVERGWKKQAPIKVMSRIDTPRGLATVASGRTVKVAGVAWAQTRGIDRVEVQVGDGPWQQATLAAVPNTETWRQWFWDWTPGSSGNQTLRVRAVDSDGVSQPEERRTPFPDGATGWHNVVVSVT
jgi:DMSO/TMAO reductase YedYZ molybdopterin-dependent catalytic subunit